MKDKKFEFRKLFPFCYHRFKKGYSFSLGSFYADMLLYSILLTILMTIFLLWIIKK
jgi:hypothetical protein